MASAINKDIPHDRSHTELNKHKHQAFLPPHLPYIHKLNLSLAWNSNLLVACFHHLAGKAVVLIKNGKNVVVTVEQGTQLHVKDLKAYTHTYLITNPKNPSVKSSFQEFPIK